MFKSFYKNLCFAFLLLLLTVVGCSTSHRLITPSKNKNTELDSLANKLSVKGGGIMTPDTYVIDDKVMIQDVVKLAGGFTGCAMKSRITAYRLVPGSTEKYYVKYLRVNDFVFPDDVISIPCGDYF